MNDPFSPELAKKIADKMADKIAIASKETEIEPGVYRIELDADEVNALMKTEKPRHRRKAAPEAQIDAKLAELGVKAHITHVRLGNPFMYNVVTVASHCPVGYQAVTREIAAASKDAFEKHHRDLGNVLVEHFADLRAGVALCHHLDNFSRKRGRIIAKGRLLKIYEKNRTSALSVRVPVGFSKPADERTIDRLRSGDAENMLIRRTLEKALQKAESELRDVGIVVDFSVDGLEVGR